MGSMPYRNKHSAIVYKKEADFRKQMIWNENEIISEV